LKATAGDLNFRAVRHFAVLAGDVPYSTKEILRSLLAQKNETVPEILAHPDSFIIQLSPYPLFTEIELHRPSVYLETLGKFGGTLSLLMMVLGALKVSGSRPWTPLGAAVGLLCAAWSGLYFCRPSLTEIRKHGHGTNWTHWQELEEKDIRASELRDSELGAQADQRSRSRS
jgi:hypothetical protein